MRDIFIRVLNSTKENSPALLTGVAVAGVIGTFLLTDHAAVRANHILADAYDHDEIPKDLPPAEKAKIHLKLTWKEYIPPIAIVGITITAIVSANTISTRRTAAIVSAYSVAETMIDKYKEKVTEVVGEEQATKIKEAVAKDRVTNHPPKQTEIVITGTGDVLCYDPLSDRYFQSNNDKIQRAVNEINQRIFRQMSASLNELYSELGMKPTQMGESVGWNTDNFVDIAPDSTLTEDNIPCLVMDFRTLPTATYYV